MFNAWFSAMLLGFEASEVIRLRMMRIACGGEDACEEAHLMVSEKIRAALDALSAMMGGGSAFSVIEGYREHVAANACRLRVMRVRQHAHEQRGTLSPRYKLEG